MSTTPDLGIPFISGQQAQPEVTHNEALSMVQAVLNGVVSVGLNTPPGGPTEGDSYVIGTSPTGAWAGRANAIALFIQTEWRFLPDRDNAGSIISMGSRQEGLRVYSRSDAAVYLWSDDGVSPAVFGWREITTQAVAAQDYGNLAVSNNTTTISVTAAVDPTLKTNTDYSQITGIWDAIPHGENNGVTQQTNSFTVAATGVYKIEVWASVNSDTNNTRVAIKFAVNGSIGLTRRPASSLAVAGTFYNLAAHGLVALTSGDVVTLVHAADKSVDLTWEDMVFSVNELKRG
jgi:hypothetical protein